MAITLRLSPELDRRLTKLANKTQRSKSYYARQAIEHYIVYLEDYYLGLEVSKNLATTYSLNEVEKRYFCSINDNVTYNSQP
jgi:RHH-type rel operon transcriptional repressor/antitoxin RelB